MRFELRRHATFWECEADFEIDGPWTGRMWEPLDTNAPADAIPYCCYADTVIFYRARVGLDEIARCRHRDLNTPSPSLVFLGGRWWEVGCGGVVQKDGKWAMLWRISANTNAAREANLGRDAYRRQLVEQARTA